MKNPLIQFVENQVEVKDFPQFKSGDTITVTYKIVEGNKERLQKFQGVVLQRAGQGRMATFTVRKISNNIGVERIFPIADPMIDSIEVNKIGSVRRARIYYLRGLRVERKQESRKFSGKKKTNQRFRKRKRSVGRFFYFLRYSFLSPSGNFSIAYRNIVRGIVLQRGPNHSRRRFMSRFPASRTSQPTAFCSKSCNGDGFSRKISAIL